MKNNVKVKDDTQSLQSCVSVSVTDLRINNLIFFNNNQEIGTISAIVCDLICKPYIRLNYRIDIPYDVEKIKPIPLTEEWLLKFGYSESDLETGKILVIGESFDNVNGYIIKNLSSNVVIKSVHQLQNLYYALAGSELQIGDLTEH